jgi:hypothetical protein
MLPRCRLQKFSQGRPPPGPVALQPVALAGVASLEQPEDISMKPWTKPRLVEICTGRAVVTNGRSHT